MEALLILFVFGAIAIGSLLWSSSRSQDMLTNWAAENGYRVIEANSASFFRGPFTWTTSKGQTVYRVVVEDQSGYRRSGWVRCGSWFGGLLSD